MIMGSVFNSTHDIHKIYDLKGSHYKRRAKKPKGEERNNKVPILKDLDWLDNKERLRVDAMTAKLFSDQLRRDIEFLKKLKIMDYSLLIGVHDFSKARKESKNNADQMREKFVNFDGKQTLKVIRDEFSLGSPDNDWAGVFDEFKVKIEEFVGSENKEIFCPEFSTSGPLELAITNLGLMDAMKSYFVYEVHTRCGIKAVKLLGTEDDWLKLHEKCQELRQFDLDWWIDLIEPCVVNMVATYQDQEVDPLFWESIYKHYDIRSSGAVPTIDGWITNFFPYINKKKNPGITLNALYERAQKSEGDGHRWSSPGIHNKKFPSGVSKTPFIWVYCGDRMPYQFCGGFIGAEIDSEGFVRPVQFWGVGAATEEVDPNEARRKKFENVPYMLKYYEIQKQTQKVRG